jgi:hypothetical protein
MDNAVMKNAIGGLDKMLSDAKRSVWEIQRNMFDFGGEEHEYYEHAREILTSQLQELHDVLLVVLEASQMPEARRTLAEAWPAFKSKPTGLSHTDDNPEYQYCESPALTFLGHLVKALRMTVREEVTSEQAWTLARLEAMLEDTAGLVKRRDKPPSNESELQEIMHDYLSACFPDFRHDPKIHGSIKNFEPDCGIASIGAAIEFKLVHTKEQAKVALSGVVEDTSGYKGSKEWNRFYAVIYQAEPFILKSHLHSDMKRIGADATWKAILVNGATEPRLKKKKMPDPSI